MAFRRSRWRDLCAAVGLAILLQGCTPRPAQKAEPDAAPPPAPIPVPVPPPPVGRAELLAAVAEAQSAFAEAEPGRATGAELAGRRFALRIPFGCRGPTPSDAGLAYTSDRARGTFRLTARPEVLTDEAWARRLVGSETTESIEGFWIRRPWLKTEACPALAPDAAEDATATPETVGLAQVFEKGGSRLLRRGGRAYEVTRKLEPNEIAGLGGFRLVLEGRIANGAPIRCRSDHPDQRPTCLIRVELDRVAFENAAGATLAEWRS